MGTTAKGLPYPDPTDPVANTDLAIKNLAQWINDHHAQDIVVGAQSITTNASGVATIDLPFNPTFIEVVVSGTTTYTCYHSSIGDPTQITVRNATGTIAASVNLNVRWVAIR